MEKKSHCFSEVIGLYWLFADFVTASVVAGPFGAYG